MPARNSLSQQPGPLRCGIYCRISSDDTHDELGVKRQERNCRAAVEHLGGTVVGVYVDNDRGAGEGSKERPEFERLKADLEAGLIDLVVVQNQDRISRDNVEVELFMRLLRSLGHDHYWAASAGRQGIKSTNDRMGYRVKGIFDASYREYISEKVTELNEDRARHGLPGSGGKRAFGWSCHTPRDKLGECRLRGCAHDLGLSLIPDEAQALRTAVDMLLAGQTMQATIRWLNTSGVKTVTGTSWNGTVLKHMLLAPRMVGKREQHRKVIGDAAWPPILDEGTWEQLKAEFSERYRPHARARTHRLSGVMLCPLCGYRLDAQMVTRNGHRRARYWCRPSTTTRPAGCGGIVVTRGDLLEDHVLDTVGSWFLDPDLAADITAIIRGNEDGDIERLTAQVDAEEETLKRLAREREAAGWELFEYQEQRAPVKARLDAVRAKLATARRQAAASTPLGAVTVEELAAGWPHMSDRVRREVVSTLAVVTVHKSSSGPKWNPDRVDIRPMWEA